MFNLAALISHTVTYWKFSEVQIIVRVKSHVSSEIGSKLIATFLSLIMFPKLWSNF